MLPCMGLCLEGDVGVQVSNDNAELIRRTIAKAGGRSHELDAGETRPAGLIGPLHLVAACNHTVGGRRNTGPVIRANGNVARALRAPVGHPEGDGRRTIVAAHMPQGLEREAYLALDTRAGRSCRGHGAREGRVPGRQGRSPGLSVRNV